MLDLGLKDKVAIITGGSDGLGRATAKRMAAEGAKVVICARRADHLADVAATLSADTGGEVVGIAADVTRLEDCQAVVDGTVQRFGGLDILVNNAGASAAFRLEDVSDELWQSDFDLKVMASVRMCRLAVPHMRARGGGAIVNASIGGGKAPGAGQLPTSMMRAAGLNLTKSLSMEYAADRIRVNAICIGLIRSEQFVRRAEQNGMALEDLYAKMAEGIPLGRVGEAEEYADLAAFLCSERGAFITGTAVNLDGGMCKTV